MAIKVRDYEVRLTRTKEERKQVRQLRYRVFCLEEEASATEEQKNLGEEYDSYDTYADYMAVFHNNKIVGTYRIIDRDAAEKMGGFYTEREYNLSKIKKVKGNIAEMSRACVDAEYRENGLVMRLLWAGLCEYIVKRKIVILFGVPSWVGSKPAQFAQAISYLYYNNLSPLHLRATVLKDKLEPGVDPRMTHKSFGTCDVFVMVQTKNVDKTYQKHFAGSENAFDEFDIKAGPLQIFGKIVASPFTGAAKAIRAFAELFMREDADDVEYISKENSEEESEKQGE